MAEIESISDLNEEISRWRGDRLRQFKEAEGLFGEGRNLYDQSVLAKSILDAEQDITVILKSLSILTKLLAEGADTKMIPFDQELRKATQPHPQNISEEQKIWAEGGHTDE